MKKFLRNNDSLGSWPKMNYKSKQVFGTTLGGCCSLIVNITLGLYVGVILIGFFASADYNLQSIEMYQDLLRPNKYQIDATEIIPAIAVLTNFQPDLDPEVYDMSFILEGPDESGNVVVKERKAPIKCDEYIEKYL